MTDPVTTPAPKKRFEEAKERAIGHLDAAKEVLKDYGGLPSNIPWNSPYWDFMNRHQSAFEEWKRLEALGL